jgi:tRNA (pseudouridine54-N1)-methyltransferase
VILELEGMRRFIVIGHRVATSGDFNLNDLCGSAGRLDILLRCINSSFFLSHAIRRDVELFLILKGEPHPPRTIRVNGREIKYLNPDERSTAALIRNALLKKLDGEVRSTPGIYISKRNFEDVIEEVAKTQLIYLKEDGENIKDVKIKDNATFVLSDDRNLNEEEESILEKYNAHKVSLGPLDLHTDHCIILVHNEMDRRDKLHEDKIIQFESTDFGKVVIDGRTYGDVLIVNNEVVPRNKGFLRRVFGTSHKISEEEIERLLEGDVEVIVIGTGQSGVLFVDSQIIEKIKSANVELVVAKTPEAIKLFNSLAKEKKVNALIHTTC